MPHREHRLSRSPTKYAEPAPIQPRRVLAQYLITCDGPRPLYLPHECSALDCTMPLDDAQARIEEYEKRLDVHGPEPAFNEDGVDLTQIRESLALTPLERLYRVEDWVNSLSQVRVTRGAR